MNTSDILLNSDLVLKETDSVDEAMKIFRTTNASGLAVVNTEQTVVGVISGSDLFTNELGVHIPTYVQLLTESKFEKNSDKDLPYAASQLIHATCSDIMNQSVFFAHMDTSVEVLAAIFAEHPQGVIPVVDPANKFIGVVTPSQIYKILAKDTVPPPLLDKKIVRPVDSELGFVKKDMKSNFALIAKSKAKLWLSTTLVLFIIGFALGIIFIVDPKPIMESLNDNFSSLLEKIF